MTKIAILSLVLLLSVALTQQTPGQSRQLKQNEIVPTKVRDMLRAEGYTVSIDKENDVEWEVAGTSLWVSFEEGVPRLVCEAGVLDEKNQIPISRVNEFNIKYFSKAYKTDKGVRFERAVFLLGGLPEDNLMNNLLICRSDFIRFIREVVQQ